MTETDGTPRTALITGAARRIGRAIAADLARHGWQIVIHFGANAGDAEEARRTIISNGGKALAIGADLADAGACERLLAESTAALGPVSCLVNNASLFIEDSIETLDPEIWDRQMAVNLKAPVMLAKAFAARLPVGMDGNIINIIDQRVLAPTPEFLSYSVAKAGLYAATRMLAQALAPRIRVNGIGPGPVLPNVFQTEAMFTAEVNSTLLGRATPPDEIAAAVRFILDAPSLTGQMIAIDAGQHLGWRRPA